MKAVKNHPLLLRAFSLMQEPSCRLMFVGSGEGERELRDLVCKLGISERVIFAGFQSDPTAYFDTADLFVLSSNSEGFGNVIVEALARGTPVVSTDCPSGPSEILEGGKYGRLVPVGDPEAMAAAIVEELGKTHDHDALRRRGAEFSVEKAADQYLALLDPGGRILAGH